VGGGLQLYSADTACQATSRDKRLSAGYQLEKCIDAGTRVSQLWLQHHTEMTLSAPHLHQPEYVETEESVLC